jgi:hypothetical protein
MASVGARDIAVERCLRPVHDIIEQQVHAYRELLLLAKTKQEALVAGDVAALEAIVTGEQELLRTLGWLELSYSEACAGLGRKHGLRAGEVQDRLGDLLDGPEATRAVVGLGELSELGTQLSFMVAANSELIRRARAYVDFSLGQLGRMAQGPAYDKTGAVISPAKDTALASVSRRV